MTDIEIKIENLRGHPKFYKIVEELARLHQAKNTDYATEKEPLGNFTRVAEWCIKYKLITPGHEAMKVAIIYKLKQLDAALKLLMTGEEGMVEGISKRLDDVAVYSIIERVLYEEGK